MKTSLFGIGVDDVSLPEIEQCISAYLEDSRQRFIILPYSLFFVEAAVNPQLKRIFNGADLYILDGTGPLFAHQLLYGRPIAKTRGIDLIYAMCALLAPSRHSLFFFGAREHIVARSVAHLRSRFSALHIAGFADGYKDRNGGVVDAINHSGADVLFVALGMPMQELWIANHLHLMPKVKIAIGIGGALEFISGAKRDTPRVLQNLGLEWLWRIFIQPQRIPKVVRSVYGFSRLVIAQKFAFHKRKAPEEVLSKEI